MALTFLPSGYDPNMGGAQPGGHTLGQLLMPNYLAGRPWEDSYAGPIMLDPADIEGSFRAQTGYDLRQAIRDVAPGLPMPAGPITAEMLDTLRVDPTTQQRAPAQDSGIEKVLGPAAMAAIGYLSGGFGLGDLYSNFMGDGITSTIQSGAAPTQVAGDAFIDGVRVAPGTQMPPAVLDTAGQSFVPSAPGSNTFIPSTGPVMPPATLDTGGQQFRPTGPGPSGNGTVFEPVPGPTGTLPPLPPPPPGKDSKLDTGLKLASAAAGLAGAGGSTVGSSGAGLTGELDAAEAERQARVNASRAAVDSAFAGFDDNFYLGIADAYKKFQTPLFQEQVAAARRALPASVASTQSSAFQRKAGQLDTDIQRQEVELGKSALTEANNRRGQIDLTRADLLNMADSGAETESVAAQATAKASQAAAPAQFTPLADLFSKYVTDASYAALQRQQATPAPAAATRPLLFSGGTGRSVRTIR